MSLSCTVQLYPVSRVEKTVWYPALPAAAALAITQRHMRYCMPCAVYSCNTDEVGCTVASSVNQRVCLSVCPSGPALTLPPAG